jgi:hypothetical protein
VGSAPSIASLIASYIGAGSAGLSARNRMRQH